MPAGSKRKRQGWNVVPNPGAGYAAPATETVYSRTISTTVNGLTSSLHCATTSNRQVPSTSTTATLSDDTTAVEEAHLPGAFMEDEGSDVEMEDNVIDPKNTKVCNFHLSGQFLLLRRARVRWIPCGSGRTHRCRYFSMSCVDWMDAESRLTADVGVVMSVNLPSFVALNVLLPNYSARYVWSESTRHVRLTV